MKMLMIIIDESKKEELEVFLDHAGVAGYTELSPVAGAGSTGLRLGSRAFPKSSAVLLTMLEEEALTRLVRGVDEFCATCGEKLKMLSWEIEVLR